MEVVDVFFAADEPGDFLAAVDLAALFVAVDLAVVDLAAPLVAADFVVLLRVAGAFAVDFVADVLFAAVLVADVDLLGVFFAADELDVVAFAAVDRDGAVFVAAEVARPVALLLAAVLLAAVLLAAAVVVFAVVALVIFSSPETNFLSWAPALNFGTAVFFARLRSPVRGLRTMRDGRTTLSKAPKPVMATFSPLTSSRVTTSMTDCRACPASFLLPS